MNTLCDTADRANQKDGIAAITAWTTEPEIIQGGRGLFKKLCDGAAEQLISAAVLENDQAEGLKLCSFTKMLQQHMKQNHKWLF